jgi:hypothetical protein
VFLQVSAITLQYESLMLVLQVNTSGEDSKSGCAVQVLSLHHHPPPPRDAALQEAPTLAQHIISRCIPAALGRCNIALL